MDEMKPISIECQEARDFFAQALEDSEAERRVLSHAARCPDCMAAFVELRETVDKLMAAATAVPPSKEFASAVLTTIRKQEKRRWLRKLILGGLTGYAIAVGVVLVLLLASRDQSVPDPAPSTEFSWPDGTSPAPTRPAQEPAKPPTEPSKPAPDPEIDDAAVKAFTGEILKAEKKILERGHPGLTSRRGPGRGFFKRQMGDLMVKGRKLGLENMKAALKALKEGEKDLIGPRRRIRGNIVARLNDLIAKELRSGRRGDRKKGGENRKK